MKTPIQVFFADHHLLHLAVESTSERKPFSSGERSLLGGWGVWESVFVWSSLTVWDGFPSPGGRGLSCGSRILRLRLWLRSEWQGGKYTAKSENSRNRENNHIEKPNIPTKKGFVVMCIEFWLILGTLFFDWFMCLALNKSGSCRAVCRWIV